ncbi:MAG: hypothetical protein WAS72_13265, partial [Saprospiraceae bacterium]
MNRLFFFLCIIILSCVSCNTLKYIPEGKHILNKNIITFENPKLVQKKSDLNYYLATTIKPKPNTKFLRFFRSRLWFHYKTNDKKDLKFVGRWLNKNASEPPVYVDTFISKNNLKAMQLYLNRRGYF